MESIMYSIIFCTNGARNAQVQPRPLYPDGLILQEEAMEIVKRLEREELTDFTASNGWLDKWKQIYNL